MGAAVVETSDLLRRPPLLARAAGLSHPVAHQESDANDHQYRQLATRGTRLRRRVRRHGAQEHQRRLPAGTAGLQRVRMRVGDGTGVAGSV